ncbi:MAG: bifunctional oligoribonuclease/PAP phosphatase NrnA [Candidatus Omnitrophica bacterium]|nr:bifunctional oligoribonuclease/PAP phosphatase NrnA [Candidatus Omnitrophota bacterium]
MKKDDILEEFFKALMAHDDFLLSCHISPEGDAIGSILAMESLLRRLGKKTFVVCEDPIPERLRFLSDQRWHLVKDVNLSLTAFKALVTADCPTLDRLGSVKELLTPDTVIFNIDHHISNARFGLHNYIRSDAAASAELVLDIFHCAKLPLTKEEATNLYVAISTDTGSFKFSNTTIHCHRIAAELIGTGIDIEKINDQIYSTFSLNKMNLYSRLLGRVKTSAKGRIAWVGMERRDLKHSGATYEDTEGFIDFLKCLKEVRVAFFMSEMPDGKRVKISFRSRGAYDVNKIATYFQGGGHKKASSCILRVPLKKAEKIVLDRLRKEFVFP